MVEFTSELRYSLDKSYVSHREGLTVMAFIECHFTSHVLGISTTMNVILPQSAYDDSTPKFPTLYLLHGLSDDHSGWMRRTSIERYAEQYRLAIVMPAVNRSFYTDMVQGHRYWTFVTEELPQIARSMFPLSALREHNYVAGLSMGGYGALKIAMTLPEKYSAGASLSGVTDVSTFAERRDREELARIFGDLLQLPGSKHDLFALANQQTSSQGVKPLLYQCCGTEDFLYEDNVRFRDYCRKIGLAVTYEEESGVHDWAYWDYKIQRVLEWLPIPDTAKL
jgi:putative tributyrin esterase